MNGCVYKTADGQCEKFSDPVHNTMSWCLDGPCGDETPSNADKIRAMSDEELAERMSEMLPADCFVCPVLQADCPVWESNEVGCKEAMLKWLKSPVKEEE